MWEKEISLVMEDPLGRDTLAGLHKPEQPTRKYNGGRRAVSGEERKLSDIYRERFVDLPL
ncbi:hypothetical protein NC651_014023 [Populus alba x Populus x berolinensis]|nr:hypothetical protein NC651_014023 [Populus alba x Populus x berolinensis]